MLSNKYLQDRHLTVSMLFNHSFRGHLKLAQQFSDELGVLASSVTGVDMELKTETSLRHARTLLAANQYSQVSYSSAKFYAPSYSFTQVSKRSMMSYAFQKTKMEHILLVLSFVFSLMS